MKVLECLFTNIVYGRRHLFLTISWISNPTKIDVVLNYSLKLKRKPKFSPKALLFMVVFINMKSYFVKILSTKKL